MQRNRKPSDTLYSTFFALQAMNVLKDRISREIRTNRLVYSLGIDDKMEREFVFYSYAINEQQVPSPPTMFPRSLL